MRLPSTTEGGCQPASCEVNTVTILVSFGVIEDRLANQFNLSMANSKSPLKPAGSALCNIVTPRRFRPILEFAIDRPPAGGNMTEATERSPLSLDALDAKYSELQGQYYGTYHRAPLRLRVEN